MDKNLAIPQGYMTIGEVAKKMDVTVRTLQHYDREGVLPPSSVTEGGRRLYTDRDIVKLHQILSLKHLGFSLDDIKNRLIPLDTPSEVALVLAQQAADIKKKLENLAEALRELEALQGEVLQMQTVDFKKYADIIVNLQMKNDFYWLIKHFDDQTLDHIRSRFDKESGLAFINAFTRLQEEAIQLQDAGVPADSPQGQDFARAYWDMIMDFTDGDMSLIPKLMEFGNLEFSDKNWQEKQERANAYVQQVLDIYLAKSGFNPF